MATPAIIIDSEATELRFAKQPLINSVADIWYGVPFYEFGNSGIEIETTDRRILGKGGARSKGPVISIEGSLEFTEEFYQNATQARLPQLMRADYRERGVQVVTAVDIDLANPDEYEVTDTSGFVLGGLVKGYGFANAANNAVNVITAIVANVSVEVASGLLVAEAVPPAGAYIQMVGFRGSAGDYDVDAAPDYPRITSTAGVDFLTIGLVVGEFIYVGGDGALTRFATEANNGFKRVRSFTAAYIEIDKSDLPMVTEANVTSQVQLYLGRVLKDEKGALIKKNTSQFEQLLGAVDTDLPAQIQSQYFTGADWAEATFEWPLEDTLTVEATYVVADIEYRTGIVGLKPGTRPLYPLEDAFSTMTDYKLLRLSTIVPGNESPTGSFVDLSEMSMNVNNDATLVKALRKLAAIATTSQNITVEVELMPFFTNVQLLSDIRENKNFTLHGAMVKNNAGWIFDLPLGACMGGQIELSEGEPIMAPITFRASEGSQYNAAFTHTLIWSFFSYLPNIASTFVPSA